MRFHLTFSHAKKLKNLVIPIRMLTSKKWEMTSKKKDLLITEESEEMEIATTGPLLFNI